MNRIMFAGPSGVGKTTLSKALITSARPFISASVSDLLPQTRDMQHKDMLARDSEELYKEDFQILNLRNKRFKDKSEFVTDRSYLDSAAYFLYKQADKIPQCEIENFLDLSRMLLSQQCDALIFVPFTKSMMDGWVTEDNGKRISSKYFQREISSIMEMILDIWDIQWNEPITRLDRFGGFLGMENTEGIVPGTIESHYGKIKVFKLLETNLEKRIKLLNLVIKTNEKSKEEKPSRNLFQRLTFK